MNLVPAFFIHSVCHSVSRDSLYDLNSIPSPTWSTLASRHLQVGKDLNVGTILYDSPILKHLNKCKIERLLVDQSDQSDKIDVRYDRIQNICFNIALDGRETPRVAPQLDKILDSSRKILSRFPRRVAQQLKIMAHVNDSLAEEYLKKSKHFWQIPVERINPSNFSRTNEIFMTSVIEWHIRNNPNLKQIRATPLDFLWPPVIIEAWIDNSMAQDLFVSYVNVESAQKGVDDVKRCRKELQFEFQVVKKGHEKMISITHPKTRAVLEIHFA
ncbi:hypothetical protein L596_025172 [Steinernema carpocapsae]|uniref:F-box domain-containing protein n=1 Tax=Steinernema carpocapsae TaxID=34508 RepID=A0A4U5M769_STECR|nr:hypothetical protein L596_025172 [Steinernema carpocapsae]